MGSLHIADRVLCSELVHADGAREVLRHVTEPWRRWCLEGLVGDWLAMVAHRQRVAHMIRPDPVPGVSPWAGDETTIFTRLGLEPQPYPETDEQ